MAHGAQRENMRASSAQRAKAWRRRVAQLAAARQLAIGGVSVAGVAEKRVSAYCDIIFRWHAQRCGIAHQWHHGAA